VWHQLSIRGISGVGCGWGVWNVGAMSSAGNGDGIHQKNAHIQTGSCDLFTVAISHPTMHKLRGYSWTTKNDVERIYYVYSLAQNYFFAYWNDPQFLRNAAVCLITQLRRFERSVSHVTLHSRDYGARLFLFGQANFVKGV
jgi:hypothetical protein